METRIAEIADRIYRLSTFVPETATPAGITFNQFLIDADEPLLFHCGQRFLFPTVSAAAARIIDFAAAALDNLQPRRVGRMRFAQ